jgi:opacity protein-like surface antigen
MKFYCCSLILFLIFINVSFAQDSSKTIHDELKHGLEFQIGSQLNLINFDNYTFSYRYCLNNNSGIRIGLYTSVNKDDYDLTQQSDSIYNNPLEYSHNYNFKISIQYLRSIMSFNKFSLIWGGGPFISYYKNESRSENLYTSYVSQYENKEETFSYGIDLILGVEYNLSENVILSGEYGVSIFKANSDIDRSQNYIYNDGTPNRVTKENGERHSFITRGLGVSLGLSIFF